MNAKKMEIPRIGSFDKEYGRKNGKLMLPRSLWTETKKESVPMPVQPLRPIQFHRFAQIGISFHIVTGRLLDRMQ